MKKVTLFAIAAITTTAASANVPANCPKAFQGFHLGGNVGIGLGTGSQSTSLIQTDVLPAVRNNVTNHSNRLGIKGFDGGLNTGYTHRFGNFGLGLEFVANWANSKGTLSGNDFTTLNGVVQNNPLPTSFTSKARLNNSLQVRANFSYVIANLVAPKLIIGYDASKWKTTTTYNNAGYVTAQNGQRPFTQSHSKYLNGFLIGAGVDFLATRHFILGMDATLSMFNKISRTSTVANPPALIANNPDALTQRNSFKPSPYGKISLVAKFIY